MAKSLALSCFPSLLVHEFLANAHSLFLIVTRDLTLLVARVLGLWVPSDSSRRGVLLLLS